MLKVYSKLLKLMNTLNINKNWKLNDENKNLRIVETENILKLKYLHEGLKNGKAEVKVIPKPWEIIIGDSGSAYPSDDPRKGVTNTNYCSRGGLTGMSDCTGAIGPKNEEEAEMYNQIKNFWKKFDTRCAYNEAQLVVEFNINNIHDSFKEYIKQFKFENQRKTLDGKIISGIKFLPQITNTIQEMGIYASTELLDLVKRNPNFNLKVLALKKDDDGFPIKNEWNEKMITRVPYHGEENLLEKYTNDITVSNTSVVISIWTMDVEENYSKLVELFKMITASQILENNTKKDDKLNNTNLTGFFGRTFSK